MDGPIWTKFSRQMQSDIYAEPRLLDVRFEYAQTDPVHAPKTANINGKLDSLQHFVRTTAAKSQRKCLVYESGYSD